MTHLPDAAPANKIGHNWLGWIMLGMVLCELFYLYSGIQAARVVSCIVVLSLPVISYKALKLREAYLLTVCFILLALFWFSGQDVMKGAGEALSRSAYLASFILLMALLREGALKSPAVLEVGTFLTQQPSSRRFMTLFAGGHFFAVLINLGALSLLSPIIQRGVRAKIAPGEPLDDIAQVRERRQLSAALRGFSWFLLWAPTAVTQAVMPPLMPGIDPFRLFAIGACVAIIMAVYSWAEDSLRWRGFAKKLAAENRTPLYEAPRFPARAARNLAAICLVLIAATLIFTWAGSVTIVTGVMLAAPVVVTIWVWVQQPSDQAASRTAVTASRLEEITFVTMPGYIREAVFIACAGFIGTMAAKLVPADQVAAAIGLSDLPGWFVMLALTVSVWFFGQLGLSPITMAVFLASVVANLPGLPVDMTLAALAIAAGTAVCTTGAPFASGALMLSRATGYSSMTLTWRWNGTYTLGAMLVLGMIYAVLDTL